MENSVVDVSNKGKRMSTAPHVSEVADCSTLSKEATTDGLKLIPELSNSKSSKENVPSPVIAAVEGGFHTQFLLFTKNDVSSASAAAKAAYLLKVHSNCCWDSIRPRILEMIARHCPDSSVYPPLEKMYIDGFLVEILPKSDCPEMLPPEAQKKLMSRTLRAIGVRVTVDHSVINRSLCTSLATGLSAFTKLKMKFPSEKSYGNIESSQSDAEKRGSVLSQMSTNSSFRSVSTRPRLSGTIRQSSSTVVVTGGNLDKSHLQTARPINLVHMAPASSQSLASSSTGYSAKSALTTSSVGDAKPPMSDKTVCARQPVPLVISPVTEMSTSTGSIIPSVSVSDMTGNKSPTTLHSSMYGDIPAPVMVLPLSTFSSEFSSFPTTDASNSKKNRKSLLSPITVPKCEKITKNVLQSRSKDANCGSQIFKPHPTSTVSQNVCEVKPEVIVVEEDDVLPLDTLAVQLPMTDTDATISCVKNSSVQSSPAQLQSSVSHLSDSVAVQNVGVHEYSTLPDLSVSDVPSLSSGATHSILVADVNENIPFTDPVIPADSVSVNTAGSQPTPCQQLVQKETAICTAECECSAISMEQVMTDEPSGNTTSAAKVFTTGYHVTSDGSPTHLPEDTASATRDICIRQPVVHKVEELSENAEDYSMSQQKQADDGQQSHDLGCLSVASTSADEIVCGAAGNERQLSLLSELDDLKPVDFTEQSFVTASQHQQPYPAESLTAPVPEDNVVEIFQSDEVCVSLLK